MPLVRHEDPLAFLDAAREALARDEAEGVLLESRARALLERGAGGTRAYLATYADARWRGAALRRGDDALILAPSDPVAVDAIADDLAAEASALPGVYGGVPVCEAFCMRWRARTGATATLRIPLRHHRLHALVSPAPPAGAARVADMRDAEWLTAAQVAFIAESGVPDRADEQRDRIARAIARGALWIWEDGARVAYAGFDAPLPDAARVGPVYTEPSSRARGYASALVAKLCAALAACGRRRIFLSTDQRNPTSNAIYARLGFRPAGDVALYDFAAA